MSERRAWNALTVVAWIVVVMVSHVGGLFGGIALEHAYGTHGTPIAAPCMPGGSQ